MTKEQLDELVGLDLTEAEAGVRATGMVPRSYADGTVTTLACLPGNVVKLVFDAGGKVLSAETQASIDAKYGGQGGRR